MPQWVIAVQCTLEADSPDEANAWLADELNRKLSPGEEGSRWKNGVGEAPRYQLASIQARITRAASTQCHRRITPPSPTARHDPAARCHRAEWAMAAGTTGGYPCG
jgi:hypothetical protein